MFFTKNFNPKTDPKLLCTCGHPDCDKRSVSQATLDRLQKVRDTVGSPLRITSGGRCPLHEEEKHRTVPADHQKCIAVDIAVGNSPLRGAILKSAIEEGFNAIGISDSFIHLGYREDYLANAPLIWTY